MQLPITGYSADVLRSPVFSADIDASGLGVNTVVAGVPGKRIVVLRYKRVASNTVGVTWESSGGTVLDGPCLLAPSGGEAEPLCPIGLFATLPGEDLVLNLDAAVQVGGSVNYLFS